MVSKCEDPTILIGRLYEQQRSDIIDIHRMLKTSQNDIKYTCKCWSMRHELCDKSLTI